MHRARPIGPVRAAAIHVGMRGAPSVGVCRAAAPGIAMLGAFPVSAVRAATVPVRMRPGAGWPCRERRDQKTQQANFDFLHDALSLLWTALCLDRFILTGGLKPSGTIGSGRANLMRIALPAFAQVKASAGIVGSSCQLESSNW